MKYNMNDWTRDVLLGEKKKAIPVLSFPSVQLLGITVRELISDAQMQAKGMLAVAKKVNAGASVSLMDLSIEAECFGCPVSVSDDEVPTVTAPLFDEDDEEDERMDKVQSLEIPEIGSGRTSIYIDAIYRASTLIDDRPVFAGVIGPFSLAGRLLGVTSSLIYCMEEPEMVHAVVEKCAEFITRYIKAYKQTGCNGVVMAEPLAGLLSPAMAKEFSGDYCRKISAAIKDENFAFIYHNCGNTANVTTESITQADANAYHFGNAVDMEEILKKMPEDKLCLGNIDPAGLFRHGTPKAVYDATSSLLEKCGRYKNFIISSGCDIPPMSSWDNIDAFFRAVDNFYGRL